MNLQRRSGPRFFVEHDLSSATIELDRDAAHYAANVLRLRPGDRLVVFNGRGTEREATVATLTKRGATLQALEHADPLPEPRVPITLLPGLAKGEAMDLIVQKATELGVSTVLPIVTQYSVVKLDSERSVRRLAHWQKIAHSACEQCGRHTPPQIQTPVALSTCFAMLPADALKLVLHPGSDLPLPSLAGTPPPSVCLMSGPEGGFSADDLGLIEQAGFTRVHLGPRTLRAETAALAACVLAQALWGDLI
jgi:16S rRNA (uracil1498-N3)-methyltransferase